MFSRIFERAQTLFSTINWLPIFATKKSRVVVLHSKNVTEKFILFSRLGGVNLMMRPSFLVNNWRSMQGELCYVNIFEATTEWHFNIIVIGENIHSSYTIMKTSPLEYKYLPEK